MRKILILSFILFWLLPGRGAAQITIHPEVGISHLPYEMPDFGIVDDPDKLSLLFGIAAHLPLHTKWFVKSRICYTKKGDLTWKFIGFDRTYRWRYSHSDLNIDIMPNYIINKYINLGVGPTIIRSLAEVEETIYVTKYYNFNSFNFALNSGLSLGLEKLKINITYMRIFRKDQFHYVGNDRIDLTVSYHLLGGKKEKKR